MEISPPVDSGDGVCSCSVVGRRLLRRAVGVDRQIDAGLEIQAAGGVVGDHDRDIAVSAELGQSIDPLGDEHLLVKQVLARVTLLGGDDRDLLLLAADDLRLGAGDRATADDLVGVGLGLRIDTDLFRLDLALFERVPSGLDLLAADVHVGDRLLGGRVERDVAQVDVLDDDTVVDPLGLETDTDVLSESLATFLDLERIVRGRGVAHLIADHGGQTADTEVGLALVLLVDLAHTARLDADRRGEVHRGVAGAAERSGDRGTVLTDGAVTLVHELDDHVAHVEGDGTLPGHLESEARGGVDGRDLARPAADDGSVTLILRVGHAEEQRDDERDSSDAEDAEQTDEDPVVEGSRVLRRSHAPTVPGEFVVVRRGVVEGGVVIGARLLVGLLEAPPHEQARDHDDQQEDEPDGRSHASGYLSQCALSPVS